ncbi:PadR family transcriptional regulator [Blastococcus brunescens]|uniref:PadR family transcriptional regulator n=1 Tax=Blastococcus brunescens TaxID=1564165 RepID=A0ABZ1AYY1_9ACTN|nr:PadR family transcriptional regulator [Blastococcus sp. BMG 8361]WRL63778.1 PadR family transcriptional regulator [Blastococcus sp. BMG 8361]
MRSISYGSLYPALKRMRAAGLISSDEPDPHALLPADAPPLTGRRGKVVYTITAEGKERFHELVSQTGPEAYDDGGLFGVRLAFFRHTASDARLRILEDAVAPSSSSGRGCGPHWRGPASGWTATPSSCSATAWSRWIARSAGSRS